MILLGIFILLTGTPLHTLAGKKLPTDQGCIVNLRELNDVKQPLVLETGGSPINYISPRDTPGMLYFKKDEVVRLVCIGQNNHLTNLGDNNQKDVAAFCVGNKTFRVNSLKLELGEFRCSEENLSVARKTEESCLVNHTKIEIGFDLGYNEFLTTIEICRDETRYRTLYAKFRLTKFIGGFQSDAQRPPWRQNADFWGSYNMDNLYQRKTQTETCSYILNSCALSQEYLSLTSTQYLSRGHLVANADFLYTTARRSTFWYINSSPQWTGFNNGNWKSLEDSVRKYARSMKLDLDVYTGTHEIMTLRNVRGEQPLYLHASDNGTAIEVPLYFWKIVYDPNSQRATAFVGVNNPYITHFDYYVQSYYINKMLSPLFVFLDSYPSSPVVSLFLDAIRATSCVRK